MAGGGWKQTVTLRASSVHEKCVLDEICADATMTSPAGDEHTLLPGSPRVCGLLVPLVWSRLKACETSAPRQVRALVWLTTGPAKDSWVNQGSLPETLHQRAAFEVCGLKNPHPRIGSREPRGRRKRGGQQECEREENKSWGTAVFLGGT